MASTKATTTPPVSFPRWTQAILDALATVIAAWGLPVHDPFAGEGERLGLLCDHLGVPFSGTEIEPEYILDPRVRPGDSTQSDSYPAWEHVVVTSPAYPNGWTDHFHARDASRRHTYRQALAVLLGHDRPLHPNNMGRYGFRQGKRAEAKHYRIAAAAVRWWPPHVAVNVSDFIHHHDQVHAVVGPWVNLLGAAGYHVADPVPVATPRQRHGANGRVRVEHEHILIASR